MQATMAAMNEAFRINNQASKTIVEKRGSQPVARIAIPLDHNVRIPVEIVRHEQNVQVEKENLETEVLVGQSEAVRRL